MNSLGNSYWFSPAPSEISSSRISLTLAFEQLTYSFVNWLSPKSAASGSFGSSPGRWPHSPFMATSVTWAERCQSRTAICHGIEALACKLEFHTRRDEPSYRILGKRRSSGAKGKKRYGAS